MNSKRYDSTPERFISSEYVLEAKREHWQVWQGALISPLIPVDIMFHHSRVIRTDC